MEAITETNESPLVVIVTLLLLCIFVCAFLIKTIVKVVRRASVTAYDDVLLTLAAVCLQSCDSIGSKADYLSDPCHSSIHRDMSSRETRSGEIAQSAYKRASASDSAGYLYFSI